MTHTKGEIVGPELLPLATYILITTFTPGLNNIIATTAGARLGFRKANPYLAGIVAGFFIVMLFSGFFNLFLNTQYATVAGYVKWLGFFYMLWLAASLFLHGRDRKSRDSSFSFLSGMLLQLVNPKVILYGITLYGTFSKSLLQSSLGILSSAMALSVVAFASVLTWCLAGTAFTQHLKDRTKMLIFNIVMAALLLFSAFSIILE